MKTCIKCKIEKSKSEFYIRSKKTPQYLRSECKECTKELDKERKEYFNQYNKDHYDDYKEYRSEWFKSQKYRNYTNNKRHNDPILRIHRSISTGILLSLKSGKESKTTFGILDYSLEDLINHLITTLPEGYTLDDYGDKLQIDHIIAKSLYDIVNIGDEEFSKCWNLKNLRFLPTKENIKKKDKFDMNLVEKYNIYDLLPNKYL